MIPAHSRFPFTVHVLGALAIGFAFSAPAIAEDPKPTTPPAASTPIAELKRDTPVDFEKELLPILKNNCLACHNQTKAKADLVLETPQTILKGGESGPAVVPGKAAESLMLKASARQAKPFMPPRDNKVNAVDLTPEQLGLLKLWIDQGAKGEVRAPAAIAWLEQPPALDPIYALALTQDGQFAAAGRGNRIDVYHVPSGQLVARLTDPKLAGAAGFTNAAHRDLVNALAFSPDGTTLASAGYREVKLWTRPRDVRKASFAASNAVQTLALSHNRKWLATVTTNNDIALWDAVSGQPGRLLSGHSNTVTSLNFSADGARLASASKDKTVRAWNVANGAQVAMVELPSEANAVTWLDDGCQLAVGSADSHVRVFALPPDGTNALTLAKELEGHTAAVTALEILPGGKGLLSGSADGTLRQWDVAEAKSVRELKHEAPVTAIAVRPDGKRFASAGTNKVVRLWNADDGKQVAELKGDRYANELAAETGRALTIAKGDVEFRKKSLETSEFEEKKQGERLTKAADTNAATERIFVEKDKVFKDASAAKAKAEKDLSDLLSEIQKITEGFEHADKAAKEAATKAKSASGKAAETKLSAERAALAKTDAEKIVTDAATVAARTKAASDADLPPEAKAAAHRVAEDAAGVATKTKAFAEAVAADAEAKRKLAVEAAAAAEKAIEEVASLSFGAGQLKPGYDKTLAEAAEKRKNATNQIDSATKALASADGDFKKAETRKSVTNHELELAQESARRASNSLATAKSDLASVESSQKKVEGDLEKSKQAAAAAEQRARALAFSPDNRTLATSGDDHCIHTWSADTGVPFEVLHGHTQTVAALAFADATTLISGSEDQRVVVWDLQPAWSLARVIGTGDQDSPLSDRVNAVDFSPDGKVLATASGEPTRSGEVKLWNVSDGTLHGAFTNVHSDAVLSLDFSADGRFLASSSADRFVRVVELATGKVVKAFEGHTSYVLGVAWKRDSRTLASAGADKMIKVWDFVSGERKKNIEGAEKEVTAIAFVGATGEAVAASGDSQVRLVRENGEKVRSFDGATEFMNTVAVTPDGMTVVAGGQDGMMYIWDGSNGKKLATFGPSR